MTKSFTLLPTLISQHYSNDELALLANTLGVDPENIFPSGSTNPIKAQKLYMNIYRNGRIFELLQLVHEQKPTLPLSPYLHLLMVGYTAYPPDEIKKMYVDLYADEQGLYYDTNTEKQAQKIQEYYETNDRAQAFFDMVASKFPPVKNTPYLNPALEQTSATNPISPSSQEPEYVNFDININPSGIENVYHVTAVTGTRQTQNIARQTLPDDSSFTATLAMFQNLLVNEASVTKLGQLIHRFLFPSEVSELFKIIKDQNKVRVRINIFGESLQLHQIPWEYCRFDEEFLATDLSTPIVRFIPTDQEATSLQVPEKMRVLVALASPADKNEIDIEAEAANIRKALSPIEESGKIELRIHEHMTNDDLIDEFMDFEPHVFHFVGHGGTKDNGEGFILLEDDEGNASEFDAEDMMTLIKTANEATKLVIFAACESGVAGAEAEQVANGGFMGLGPRILKEVPAVIAMQYVVPQATAFAFTQNMYKYLSRGEPLDKAVTRSRISLYLKGKDKVFWGIPVLFMRSPDGKIW